MRASGNFRIDSWDPNGRVVDVDTAAPLTGAFIVRVIEGEIAGTSQVVFAGSFNEALSSGTYVAIDAFEGEVLGRRGTMNFWHTSTMRRGAFSPEDATLRIVPDSGTEELTGVRGVGRILTVDGEERIELDLEFGADDETVDGETLGGRIES